MYNSTVFNAEAEKGKPGHSDGRAGKHNTVANDDNQLVADGQRGAVAARGARHPAEPGQPRQPGASSRDPSAEPPRTGEVEITKNKTRMMVSGGV